MNDNSEQAEKEQLLLCPFCDQPFPIVSGPTCKKSDSYDPADRAYPIVRCSKCHCSIGGKNWDHTCNSAIKAWNTRPTSEKE